MDFGSIIGAGISAISKIFGGKSSDDAAAKQAEANRQAQLDFAQHGVSWKAQDATDAQANTGINRLALLGVPTNSFSNTVGSTALGDSIGNAGQDIGRAVAAATAQPSREQQLNEKLLEAKVANVNADTVRMQAAASAIATKLGQPATANVPLPREDPRGVPIQLYQRAYDYRTGQYYDIPSEKAASPLQTTAALPINAGMAARTLGDAPSGAFEGWGPGEAMQGAAARAASSMQYDPWATPPF